jgi:hypothetical protein
MQTKIRPVVIAETVVGDAKPCLGLIRSIRWLMAISLAIPAFAQQPVPALSSVIPEGGPAGATVEVTGSGFGSTQGTGAIWLGSTYGNVVSWSDTRIIATVSPISVSGTVKVRQGGAWSNGVQFSVSTAAIASVTPSSGVPGDSIAVTGSGFGASQGSGQLWLGTASGMVQSWSDTRIVAQVAVGSSSGGVQVLQNGVMSNTVPFAINTPHLTSVSPQAGGPGTSVTIVGKGFGTSQGSGTIWLGSTSGQVVSWSDTRIVAGVGADALTGIARVQQNGAWSNAVSFTVPGNTVTLLPNLLNLVVGETHTITASGTDGQPVIGLSWTSSDPAIVSLSAADPPLLSALAPGHVTIAAGAASADVTVSAGALAPGTVIWSNPGSTSVDSIVPAVPSVSGVADVFAFEGGGATVEAITSDGATAWTADVSQAWGVVPDFLGGLVGIEPIPDDPWNYCRIVKWDGITGERSVLYSLSTGAFALHPDGTIFTLSWNTDHSVPIIVGVDPTGGERFNVPLD